MFNNFNVSRYSHGKTGVEAGVHLWNWSFCEGQCSGCNSAIIACGRGGQWEVALCLLSTMLSRLCAVDLYTGYSTVWACETAGEWEVALKVLKLIPETRVWGPRTLQFFFVSHVSCEWGIVGDMYGVFCGLACAEAKPNVFGCASDVNICYRQGRWQLGLHLINILSEARCQAWNVPWIIMNSRWMLRKSTFCLPILLILLPEMGRFWRGCQVAMLRIWPGKKFTPSRSFLEAIHLRPQNALRLSCLEILKYLECENGAVRRQTKPSRQVESEKSRSQKEAIWETPV